jgi:hypothetical protein
MGMGWNTQTITLTNTGSATLNITSILTATSNFIVAVNTCGPTNQLPPTQSCSVSVAFYPTALGAFSDNLTFTTNAASSPDVIPLSGTGIAPPVSVPPKL